MAALLQFFKEWVPTAGVLAAAGWVLFKWKFDQSLRAKRDIPALTGEVRTDLSCLAPGKLFVCVDAEWQSTSSLPLFVDHKKTRIDVYEIPCERPFGPVVPKSDFGEPVATQHPLEDMDDFVFEPNTVSQIRAHFVLRTGGLYFVRIKVYRDQARHGRKVFAWTREATIDTRGTEHDAAQNGESAAATSPPVSCR